MTIYFTKNPLGSSSPYDLFDNSQNFDTAVNSITAAIWQDRFGRNRLTWYGIESLAMRSMLNYGYITAKSFEQGYTLHTPNTVLQLESNGEYYRWDGDWSQSKIVPPGSTPETAGGIGPGKWVGVGDASLRADMLNTAKGDALVGVRQPFTGAIDRTQHDKNLESVSVEDFGAIGDKSYHPLSERFSTLAAAQAQYPFVTDLNDSIDWAAAQAAVLSFEGRGGVVNATSQFYVHTREVLMPDSVIFRGRGCGSWDIVFPERPKTWGGTNILLYGAGPKTFSRRGITSMSTAGGRRLISGSDYARLSSLMNEDAMGSTPATPKAFSFGFKGKERTSRYWGVEDVRITPWIGADGTSEYSNQTYSGLASDWDGAICMEDCEYVTLQNVQGVGYFRNYGLLLANSDFDVFGGQERNRVIGCKFQGVRGISMRSGDVRKVEAITSSTVTILWDAESFWPISGQFTGFPASTFQQYSYTGLTRSGANLLFTGVTPDPTIQNLNQLRAPCRSSGAAGSIFKDTFAHGLDHTSGNKAETFGLSASTAFEISGFPMRGVAFDNFKIQSRETILYFFHDCQDVLMDKCQAEGAGLRIASPAIAQSTAPAPSGDTRDMRLHSTLGFGAGSLFTPRSTTNDMEIFNRTGLNSGLDICSPDTSPITVSSRTNGEVMRVTDDAFVGIGTVNPAQKLHIATTTPEIARLERTGNTGLVGIQFKNSNGIISLRTAPSADNAGTFTGSGDNTISCGSASFRWSTVFAGTGSINTSDGTMKKLIGELTDAEIRAWSRVRPVIFKMLDAIALKGDDEARKHAGYIAQDVRDSFLAEGLDASNYALWCEDDYFRTEVVREKVLQQKKVRKPKIEEVIEVRDGVPVRVFKEAEEEVGETELRQVYEINGDPALNEMGDSIFHLVPVMEEVEIESERVIKDGTRLGLRYDQCLVFETAFLRSVVGSLESRISSLESN